MPNEPTNTTATSPYRAALQRIRAEYGEMPGLRLTPEQVARLCGVESHACVHLLDALVDTGYLNRTPGGQYVRQAEPRRERTAVPVAGEGWRRRA